MVLVSQQTEQAKTQSIVKDSANSNTHSDSENIIIIDNISDPAKFNSRKQIYREINRVKPELGVAHAYRLPGGGICLHLKSSQDTTSALGTWPRGSFNTEKIQPHRPACKSDYIKVFAKEVPISVSTKDIKQVVGTDAEVHRLNLCGTEIPSKTVSFLLKRDCAKEIIAQGIKLGDKIHHCSPQRKIKIIRCFNCQSFGHRAKTCVKSSICAWCGQNHDTGMCASVTAYCANCGENHPAYSNCCQIYKNI